MVDAPIILTALLGDADFAWLDAQRRAYFPPDRNILAAHLTLFHHLPPSHLAEIKALLVRETRRIAAPAARVSGVISLGNGVAYRIESAGLDAIRERLAHALHGLLIPQDQAGWRAHVTVQNKVAPGVAKALRAELVATFQPRPIAIAGLAAHHYRGGPWEGIARYRFG